MTTESVEPLTKPKMMTVDEMGLDHRWCSYSTGIDDDITAGQGTLGWHGFFSIPCPRCEKAVREKFSAT